MSIVIPGNQYGDISAYDDYPIDLESAPTKTSPLEEIGATGVKRAAGIIDEEFLPALRGRKAIAVFREMSLNDPIIGAMMFAIDKLIRQVEWTVKGPDNTPESAEAVEFIEQCMDDMCYDDQTQILTNRGWVLFRELTDTDLVAQRSAAGLLEYVLPKAHHQFDFNGQLITVTGDAVDLQVSPNHRLLMAKRTGRVHDVSQKNNLEIIKAKDAYGKPGWMSKEVIWEGSLTGYTLDYLELLGFAVADGSFSGRDVVLIQKDKDYVEQLLKRNQITARTREVNGATQWVIGGARMARELAQEFGSTSRVKKIPAWLQQASVSEIEAFLTGFAVGDGYESSSGLTALYTSSRQLADDLQVLAMKTGRAATVLNRTGSPSSFAPGSAQYRVSIWSMNKEHNAPYIRRDMWGETDYQGKIYCVSVPSGVIMVRRNGKAVWSGNSHTWDDMISEILSMLVYGFSWHEIVYKKRMGTDQKDPAKRSKHKDNRIGWRKIPIRAQETHLRWIFDESGGIKAYVQIPPPYYKTCVIPIERSLLFRTNTYKGNPEGMSLLRAAYRPWFFKKRLEEFEAIGVERDLAGMPVASVPSSYMKAKAGSPEQSIYAAFKKMVQNVRRDEHEGLVLPLEYDEKGNELFKFELMSTGGSRSFDTNALIQRYEQRMLMVTMADFLLLGHEGTGSYSMHVDKTGIFRAALNTITQAIADVFNRYAIPRLFELNQWKLEELPVLIPNNVDPPDLTQLGGFMTQMSGLGMEFFPDPDLEKFLRDTAHLPELPDEVMQARREMAMQKTAMDFMGSNQKFGAVSGGMSPEQAQLQAEAPNQEMQDQEHGGQQLAQARGQMHPEVQAANQAMNQDPNAQEAHQLDMKSKEMDLKGKATDQQYKEKDHTRDQSAKEKDHTRDQKGKEADFKRDQKGKDADVKRQEFLGKLKMAQARQQSAKTATERNKKALTKKKR